jgi:hypothetical protein
VYLNELDQFVKHSLRRMFYIRYADDFVIFDSSRTKLESLIPEVETFLMIRLKLKLHHDKIHVQTIASGADFLGWVHFPYHRVIRSATRRRMMQRMIVHPTNETLQSYLGLLGHGNTSMLRKCMMNQYWLWEESYG